MITTLIDRCLNEKELETINITEFRKTLQTYANNICSLFNMPSPTIEINILPSNIYGECFIQEKKIIIYTTKKVGEIILSHSMPEIKDTLAHELAHYISGEQKHTKNWKNLYLKLKMIELQNVNLL